MARILELMQLSPTMKVGTFVKWTKKPGDAVSPDDIVAEIETDKAVMEMAAFDTGVLLGTLVEQGDQLPVGAPIAIIGEVGEDISDLLQKAKDQLRSLREQGAAPAPARSEEKPPAGPVSAVAENLIPDPEMQLQGGGERPEAKSSAAQSVREDALTGEPVRAAHPLERVSVAVSTIDRPLLDEPSLNGLIALPAHITLARSSYRTRHPISPLARKIAEAHGVDISVIQPADRKRIKASDVEQFIKQRGSSPGRSIAVAPDRRMEISGMRRVIASRLSDSKTHIPHYYLTAEFDATALIALREEINQGLAEGEPKFSINDFIVRGCALSLKRHPVVNSSWRGDHIVQYGRVDVGIAVALDQGLITPYVRNADQLSLRELAARIRELAKRAKDRKLKPEEYSDGTFTVSNLGMFGIRDFSAIINEPEAAIMAVGGIFDRATVRDGQVVATKTVTVTLSCDHRVVDGAEGASFLATFKHFMEHPPLLLV
ncbi:MAG: dihydrolipoamide succinyltransferase [Spirochaetae bacterium HGW-Spirochaetae-10]|nr:MAG: dihydrolipoamide succinyltransferase [Spirochaetae bacterium HGW-Spirochaetae-10]